MTAQNPTGRVALIGAGPGDAELITLKGARLLGRADVVVYDNLVGDGIIDLAEPAPNASSSARWRATTPCRKKTSVSYWSTWPERVNPWCV